MAQNNARLPNVEPSIAAGIPLHGKKNAQSVKEVIEWGNSTNWRKENIRKQQQEIETQKENIRKQEEETRTKELDQEKKQKLEMAKNLLKENIDIDIILKVTSLNKEDIKGLNF